jgi:hypothetical protein
MVRDDAGEWVREREHRETVERIKQLEGALAWLRNQFAAGRTIRALAPGIPTLIDCGNGVFRGNLKIEGDAIEKATE